MVSLGTFSYDLTIANSQALQALQAVERQAAATRASLQGNNAQFTLNTSQATASLSNVTKAAQAAAAQIQKPINVQVNTQAAQSQIQKFGQSLASGLGFGSGAAIAVAGIQGIEHALTETIGAGLKYNAQIETATKTLELFTGSASQAQNALQILRKYADFTPFDTDEVIQGGQAFIKVVDGDVTAMERLIHLSGQLAATNPDRATGGGFESATVALRELLGGQARSVETRFNIPPSVIQGFKDAGLQGLALAEAVVKAAHGSEELVTVLSTTATGQLSNFRSALANLGKTATDELFEVLKKGLGEANSELGTNAEAWNNWAKSVGHSLGEAGNGLLQFIKDSGAEFKVIADAIKFIEDHAPKNFVAQSGREFVDAFTNGPLGTDLPGTDLSFSDVVVGPRRNRTAGQNAGAGVGEPPSRGNLPSLSGAPARTPSAPDNSAELKAQGTALAKDLKEFQDDTYKNAVKNLDDEVKAVHRTADEKKQVYDETRDAAIRAIEAESQAFKDGIDAQVRALEVSRDRQLQAADDGHQAAIRGIEAEQQAVSRARTTEDRDRESTQQAILRGLDTVHQANQRGFDEEKRGIEQKRDAALRALDEESRVEATRHREALHNIDVEKNRKLGIIDKQLDALTAQQRQESRAETDRSLKRALSDAKGALSQDEKALDKAKTPAERESLKRQIIADKRALGDAEHQIELEQRRRREEDLRLGLQAQKDAVNAQAQTQTTTEGDIHQASDQNIQIGKQTVADQAKLDIIEIGNRSDAEKAAYDKEVQDRKDAYALDSQAIADLRRDEDAAFAARKQGVDDAYDHQKQAIDKAFNDPETGSIPILKRQGEAAERAFALQKQAANDAYTQQVKDLDKATKASLDLLQQQKDGWTKWREHIDDMIKGAGTDPHKLNGIDFSPPPGSSTGQNAGQGSGEPPSRGAIPPSLTTPSPEVLSQAQTDGAAIGESVVAGLGEGVNSEASQAAIQGAVDNQVNTNLIARAKGLLEIASPSAVFDRIGQDTAQGFADGFPKVDLKTVIGQPFTDATADGGPLVTFESSMSTAGDTSAKNFQTAWELVGLSLVLQSPFNDFFDVRAAYFYSGFTTFGSTAGGNIKTGFDGAKVGDAMYREVLGARNDLERFYPDFKQVGQNYAASLQNGFTYQMQGWQPFGPSAAAAGSGSDGLELGDPVTPPQAAGGGNIHGLALVGERGPELVNMTGQIIPADQTADILAAANGGGGAVGNGAGPVSINQTFNIENGGPDMEAWAHRVATISIEGTIMALDQAHRNQPTGLDHTQPGAV